MIQITYLILAHKSPAQLLRLLSSLQGENVNFVIHIDGNKDVAVFRNCISGRIPRVQFVEDRVPVEWGRYTMVEASLAGLSAILAHFPDTQRIVLLSGQDYPIKSSTYIRKYFEANQQKIFLSYFKIPYQRWFQGGIRRFPHYQRISGIMQLYAGSQWWSIPTAVARYILDFIKENPAFPDYFKMVDVPDESFFHTLLLNSGEPLILDHIVNCNLHLIKWDRPYMHPRCLTSSDRNIIKRSKYLFARKFEQGISDSILNFIDQEVMDTGAMTSNLKKENGSAAPLINQAFVFLTKRKDPDTLEYYHKFSTQSKPFGESVLFYHSTTDKALSAGLVEANAMLCTDEILTNMGYKAIFPKMVPGSNHFPLLQFYRSKPDLDYYWLIEDDVRYVPDWNDFFSFFSETDIKSDFISSHVSDYSDEPGWYWWFALKNPHLTIPEKFRVRSFNPIFRISNAALKFIDHCLTNGWWGHHEVLIPTLLKFYDFSISDFGGKGKYVLPGCQGRFYSQGLNDSYGNLATGSMRFRPVIDQIEMEKAFLYHPVKPIL